MSAVTLNCFLILILRIFACLFIAASTDIRLKGGAGPWEGILEIKHNGAWGTVCDTNFGVNEAKVVCNMLGFKNKK